MPRVQPYIRRIASTRLCALKNKRERCSAKRLLALSRNSGFAVRFRIVNPSSGFALRRVANDATAFRKTLQYGIYSKKIKPVRHRVSKQEKTCKDYYKYTIGAPKSQVGNNSCKNNFARADHSQPKVAGGLFVAS